MPGKYYQFLALATTGSWYVPGVVGNPDNSFLYVGAGSRVWEWQPGHLGVWPDWTKLLTVSASQDTAYFNVTVPPAPGDVTKLDGSHEVLYATQLASTMGGLNASQPPVRLLFKHAMSKVRVTVKTSPDTASYHCSVNDVVMNQVLNRASFWVRNNNAPGATNNGLDGGVQWTVTEPAAYFNLAMEAASGVASPGVVYQSEPKFLIPTSTFGGLTFSYRLNGMTDAKTATVPANPNFVYEPGCAYDIVITIDPDKVSYEVE